MKHFASFMTLMLICLIPFTGCTSNTVPQYEEYINKELGFRLEFPKDWKGRYTAEKNFSQGEKSEESYNIAIKTAWGGHLCYIDRRSMEDWTESGKGETIPVVYQILAENDKYVYIMIFPGDLQYDPENEEQVKEYSDMKHDLDNMNFYIIED